MGVKVKHKKKKLQESKGSVTLTAANGLEKNQDYAGEIVKVMEEEPTIIHVKLGYTKNLGNYESMRVDVSMSAPCKADEVDETFQTVKDWVDGKISDVLEEIDEETE